jgi:hypothetical protein
MINIQSDQFVKLSNKLEKIGRADLPVAVRSTLNQMAFKMKGSGGTRGQIDKRAEKDFDYRRNKTLFKVITGVEKAKGLDIGSMQSQAGVINKSGMSKVAEGLANQQKGGSTNQGATPLTKARISKSEAKKVRRPSYLKNLTTFDMRKRKGNRWIAAAIKAKKENKMILIEGKGGTNLLAKVKSFKRAGKDIKFKLDWMYRINDSGKVDLKKKRPFIDRAAQEVIKGMPDEFVRQANRRIQKSMK